MMFEKVCVEPSAMVAVGNCGANRWRQIQKMLNSKSLNLKRGKALLRLLRRKWALEAPKAKPRAQVAQQPGRARVFGTRMRSGPAGTPQLQPRTQLRTPHQSARIRTCGWRCPGRDRGARHAGRFCIGARPPRPRGPGARPAGASSSAGCGCGGRPRAPGPGAV